LVAIALDLLGCTRVAVKVTILLGFHNNYPRRWEGAWVSPKIAKGEAQKKERLFFFKLTLISPGVLKFFSFRSLEGTPNLWF
jgi:hypothetical protein